MNLRSYVKLSALLLLLLVASFVGCISLGGKEPLFGAPVSTSSSASGLDISVRTSPLTDDRDVVAVLSPSSDELMKYNLRRSRNIGSGAADARSGAAHTDSSVDGPALNTQILETPNAFSIGNPSQQLSGPYVRSLNTVSYDRYDIVGEINILINDRINSYVWNITPSSDHGVTSIARYIRFNFESLKITNSELRIYDRDIGTYPIWTCVGCGLIPPPSLVSRSGTIIVAIYATAAASFQENKAKFRYFSSVKRYVSEVNTTKVILTTGYDKISPLLIENSGRFLMPQWTTQIWNISTPKFNPILFSFSNFSFGSSCLSILEIYDGLLITNSKRLYRGCVDSDFPSTWIYAPSGRAIVRIRNPTTTDQSLNFLLTYKSDTTLWKCGSELQPDILRDRSMQLSDGSDLQASLAKPNICSSRAETCNSMLPNSCDWLIVPETPDSTITLVLRRVSMKIGGRIKVFDNYNASGFVLWDYEGSSQTYYTIPPPITSTGSYLFVQYTSSQTQTGTGFLGFLGEYMSNFPGSRGMGSTETHLAMSTVFDLTPPGYNTLASTQEYTTDMVYYWYIDVSQTQANSVLTFSFSHVSLPALGDSVVIYDGPSTSSPVIATLTGTSTPYVWYRSTSKVATVKFTANPRSGLSSINGGFKLNYVIDGPNYHCGFTTNPLKLTASSMIFTDGSKSSEALYADQYCEWVIEPINSIGVYIFFDYFKVYGGSLDVYIGDPVTGTLYVTIGETGAVPPPLILLHRRVSLVYTTSTTAKGIGFSATYFGISDRFAGPGDDVIKLACSSTISLKVDNPQALTPGSNLFYHVKPRLSNSDLFFFFNSFNSGPDNYLRVLSSDKSQVLATINSTNVPKSWLQVPPDVYLQYHAATITTSVDKTFDLSFYSDGPNSHCGFLTNPATLVSQSMVFTDGSPSDSTMYPGEYCEWLIKPEGTVSSSVVLEFLENDLRSGALTVYDGETNASNILWQCVDCQFMPHQLVASSKVLFVVFSTNTSLSGGLLGSGFKAVYYTIVPTLSSWQVATSGHLLESPIGLDFDETPNNQTAYWALRATESPQRIKFAPFISSTPVSDFTQSVIDGRPNIAAFESQSINSSVCGFLLGDFKQSGSRLGELVNDGIVLRASQTVSSYLSTSTNTKTLYSLSLSDSPSGNGASNKFHPSSTCKYLIDNEYTTSINIKVNKFTKGLKNSGRLQIYTGIKGDDNLAFDSDLTPDSKATIQSMSILAPCGRATILLYLNESRAKGVHYDLDITYSRRMSDEGEDCAAYIRSLHPQPKYVDPWLYYKIAGAAFGACLCLSCIAWMFRRRLQIFCKAFQFKRARIYAAITPLHPRYSPRIDGWKNKWLLKKGTCVVCQEEGPVLPLMCKHVICLDDLKGYIDAALGDISMFPVKCPMHHAGCKGNIESSEAKRVLNEPLYEKFIEFSDRSVYGEGMRCVFCNNFVNFPAQLGQPCVECPYCIQRFCIRCRKPWHYTTKCPLEKVDDSLEQYQANSRAQKCPACMKLIEKDDDGTCNHMIHKITDGIPCIRDRVDFCYLCGEEVTGDYPHEEVNNRGVNHFPDGVFQKCRIVTFREKEEERERLLRIRRMKNKYQKPVSRKVVVGPGGDGFDDIEDGITENSQNSPNLNNISLDKFDDTWNQIVNSPATPDLFQAAMFSSDDSFTEGGGGGGGSGDADYFRTLNTEPTPDSKTAGGGPSEMIVTSPQQRRVNRPQRIRVPVGNLPHGQGQGQPANNINSIPAAARSGTPNSSMRGGGRNSHAEFK